MTEREAIERFEKFLADGEKFYAKLPEEYQKIQTITFSFESFFDISQIVLKALKNETRRKAYLKYLKENMHHPDMRSEPYITQHKIHALEECEV
jgi:hypothetical protein